MTTFAPRAPLASPLKNVNQAELEPDKAWKDALREKIRVGLSSMYDDAEKNFKAELAKGIISAEKREALTQEYHQAKDNIKDLAEGTFQAELERERQERRWAAGGDMLPVWGNALVQEQHDIMNRIKSQNDAQSPSTAEPAPAGQTQTVQSTVGEPTPSSAKPAWPQPRSDTAERGLTTEERRERSLRGLERLGLHQSPPEPQGNWAEQEERARRIMDRKERERKEWERQGKIDQEKKMKEEEENKLKEAQESARKVEKERSERERKRLESQRLEQARLEQARLEKERRDKERLDRERALERARQESERQRLKGRLDRERVEKEKEKEREEKERLEKERLEKERLEKERLEKEERAKKEKERQKEERGKEEKERQEAQRKKREEEEKRKRRQEEEEAARLEEERWTQEHLQRVEEQRQREEMEKEREEIEKERETIEKERKEIAREKIAREQRIQTEREEAEREEAERHEKERSKEECLRDRDRKEENGREHERYTQAIHGNYFVATSNNSSSPSTDSDGQTSTDVSDTDDLEILSPPPPRPTLARKDSVHERPTEPPVSRSIDNHLRLSSDRPTARSPPTPGIHQIWKPSSLDDDTAARPLSAGLGRRNSVTSIKSTSSAGMRPSIVEEPIMERSDSEAEYGDHNQWDAEPEENWLPATSKPREKARRREQRKSSTSDKYRMDDNSFIDARPSYRPEEATPPPSRDRYDSQSYGSLKYHRSEEIGPRPSPNARPLHREASFNEDFESGSFHPHAPSRPIKLRPSFEDRAPYPYAQPPSQGRAPSRPASTLSDERDYYEQTYRPYPTPPSSATRPSGRDHMTPPIARYSSSRAEPSSSYGYSDEPRSNTFKFAQQQESPPKRRSSESRPTLNREPSYTQQYSDEPRPMHGPPTEQYSRTYERAAASASIPITSRQHRPSYGAEDAEGWRSWTAESHMPRRDSRRDSERRDRYNDRDELPLSQEPEYSSRNGREYEFWHPDPSPVYGPHLDPRREPGYPVRSAMASHPGSYHDTPDHSFGGRQRVYDAGDESDTYTEDMETDVEPNPRYQDLPWKRREDMRSATLEDRHRREAEERWKLLAEEEAERRRLAAEEDRRIALLEEERILALEEEEIQRREAKQDKKRKAEAKKQAKRLEEEAREREEALKEKENEIRLQEIETQRKAEEVRRQEEEAKRQAEEVKRQAAEAKRLEEEARRKEEEAKRKQVAAREEARRVREETWAKEQEMRYREEELRQKEEELRRRERVTAQKEAERRQKEEEESRREAERLQKQYDEEAQQKRAEELKKLEERFRHEQQQEEFRRREQEIQERKRQDSMGASHGSSTPSARSYTSPSPSTGVNGQTPGWSSSSKASASKASFSASASTASSASPTPKPRSGSVNSTFPTSTPSPRPQASSTTDEAEWKRKQEELYEQQQERFREEQQRYEDNRQRKESNKNKNKDKDKSEPSKEQIAALLERHERQWNILVSDTAALHWQSFPWPMFDPPRSPEDITLLAVTAYTELFEMKGKPQKDRLRDLIRRWHPDRFESKYLPRTVEGDREKVKEGMGVVIRLLNDLLAKVNFASNPTPGIFG